MEGQKPAGPSSSQPQRAVFENVLSPEECRELVFILKSCGVVGYRPHVVSCTPHDLIASNSAELVLPLLNAAVRVQQLVEARFDRECELFLEFVGLISWQPGASIGWHFDSNRDYLKQRHYSAVCYLNDQGADFSGGTFRFQTGESRSVEPLAGRVVAYSSGEENTHCVDPVTGGERTTLALWFTADPEHSKDAILLPQLKSALHRALSFTPGGEVLASVPYPGDPPDTFFVEPEAWAQERSAESTEGRGKRRVAEALDASAGTGCKRSETVEDASRTAATDGGENGCCQSIAKKRRTGEAPASPAGRARGGVAAASVPPCSAARPRHARDGAAGASEGERLDGGAAAKKDADGAIGGVAAGSACRACGDRTSNCGACRDPGSAGGTGLGSFGDGVARVAGVDCSAASQEIESDGVDPLSFEGREEDLRSQRLKALGLRFVLDRRRESSAEEPEAVIGRSADSHVSNDSGATAKQNPLLSGLPLNGASKLGESTDTDADNSPVSLETTRPEQHSSTTVPPGGLSTGHSEAEADGREAEPGDEEPVRLQWLDGERFEGEFRSKAHALQVLHYFQQCVEAPPRPADAAGSTETDAQVELPNTKIVQEGSECEQRTSAAVVLRRKVQVAGRTPTESWERCALQKWHRLQTVLEQWSAFGLFNGDCLSP